MHEEHEGILGWLDGPRLVVSAFALFLLGLSIFSILLWDGQRQQVERLDALVIAHQADQRATSQKAVDDCFAAAIQGPALHRVLRTIEREALSPRARQVLEEYRELNEFNTPTLRECRQLAERLDVPIPKGIR